MGAVCQLQHTLPVMQAMLALPSVGITVAELLDTPPVQHASPEAPDEGGIPRPNRYTEPMRHVALPLQAHQHGCLSQSAAAITGS